MSLSLASAGSPEVPRVAVAWLRTTALPAIASAIHDVSAARDRGVVHFVGVSGAAYASHAGGLLAHLSALESRVLRAAGLFESYAERLVAHEALLASVRSRAMSAGLSVVGDAVPAPSGLLPSLAWSELAGVVAREQTALVAWAQTELESQVSTYSDPDLARWAAEFLDANRVGLASTGIETAADHGSQALSTRGLLDSAEQLHRLSKVPGPASTAYDLVVALESDTPAEGLCLVAGGVALAALAPAVVAGAPAIVVAGTAIALGYAGTKVAQRAWDRLPEEVQDTLDDTVRDAWEGASDRAEDTWSWADDAVDDLGERVLTWARR